MNNSISSYSLLTDLYQLTMSYGYWKAGMHTHESVFHLFYRKNPFKGGFSIAAGLEAVIEFMEEFRFDPSDIAYLQTLNGNDGEPLFEKAFLEYLFTLKMDCTVYAIPEGTVVFPHEPLLRIQGNIILCQLLETPLLNILNFQTLIATKAARVCKAAAGESVLEFGLRRAQGKDGALSASRAAFIGGCHATSNVLAGKLYGIPVKGTHAHSWVMSFPDEQAAFSYYASAMPNNCVFLVDTYDTIQGVKYAIEEGKKLKLKGHALAGIRLDSGDLSALSIEARKLLDEAGFEEAAIVASNDLDEYTIAELKTQGAKINIWGVGTKLVTAYDQPALGGVYKLSAIRSRGGEWEYRVKLSEQIIKVSNPGVLQVRRFSDTEGNFLSDMIYSETFGAPSTTFIGFEKEEKTDSSGTFTELLVPVFIEGEKVYENPSLTDIRSHTLGQLSRLPERFQAFQTVDAYPCGLEEGLYLFKKKMIAQIRG